MDFQVQKKVLTFYGTGLNPCGKSWRVGVSLSKIYFFFFKGLEALLESFFASFLFNASSSSFGCKFVDVYFSGIRIIFFLFLSKIFLNFFRIATFQKQEENQFILELILFYSEVLGFIYLELVGI